MDLPTALVTGVQSSGDWVVIVGANADLFTASSGYNQDLGIIETIGQDPTEHLIAWKESGGYGGAVSPNDPDLGGVVPRFPPTPFWFPPPWAHETRGAPDSMFPGATARAKPHPSTCV